MRLSGSAPTHATGIVAARHDAAVLLPTLNEERGLAATLDDIPFDRIAAKGWRLLPLVIDGGSTDGTRRVAAARGVELISQRSKGKGAAIREAIDWLHSCGVRYAVVLDADATYPGSAVLPALELLAAGYQMVVGVRNPASGPPSDLRDFVHRVGNSLLNIAAARVRDVAILDVCSGFWAVDVERAHDLGLVSDGFGIEAELFLKAYGSGWSVGQIPVVYRERIGVAKLHAVRDGLRILAAIFRFGHLALKPLPPAEGAMRNLLRYLLAASLIDGRREVVLVCPPELHPQAVRIAQQLERSELEPTIVVRPPLQGSAPWLAPDTRRHGLAPAPFRFPSRRPAAAADVPTVAQLILQASGRQLYIELVEEGSDLGSLATSSGYVTSVSVTELSPNERAGAAYRLLDMSRLLVAQVKPDPERGKQRLFLANGFRLRTQGADPFAPRPTVRASGLAGPRVGVPVGEGPARLGSSVFRGLARTLVVRLPSAFLRVARRALSLARSARGEAGINPESASYIDGLGPV